MSRFRKAAIRKNIPFSAGMAEFDLQLDFEALP